MVILEAVNVSKSHSNKPTLRNVSLKLEKGTILGILGPSGCGKTTLLRIIAGLEAPESGRIFFSGKDMEGVPPHHRQFGMMFQEFALFPHKTVFDNIGFGLKIKKLSHKEISIRVHELLALVGLAGFSDRSISTLSGGERQRIALARSLAPSPRLLMLDEPMGSLDRELRERLVPDLKAILQHIGVTAIFVTHDHAEAYALADRIAVMACGEIEQEESPETLYRKPVNKTVASFLGFENFVDGTLQSDGSVETGIGVFYPEGTELSPGKDVTLLIRPEAARAVHDHYSEMFNNKAKDSGHHFTVITGTVTHRLFQGKFYRLKIKTPDGKCLSFDLVDRQPPSAGSSICLAISSSGVVLIQKSPVHRILVPHGVKDDLCHQ